MSEAVKIRQLVRADVQALEELHKTGCTLKWSVRLKDGSENKFATKGLDGTATDKDEGIRFYGMFVDDVLVSAAAVGFQYSKDESAELGRPNGFIRTIYTHPDYRRKGYGREMMRIAEDAVVRFGDYASSVVLEKKSMDERSMRIAQCFLSACGYTYEQTVEDHDCFGKQLI